MSIQKKKSTTKNDIDKMIRRYQQKYMDKTITNKEYKMFCELMKEKK